MISKRRFLAWLGLAPAAAAGAASAALARSGVVTAGQFTLSGPSIRHIAFATTLQQLDTHHAQGRPLVGYYETEASARVTADRKLASAIGAIRSPTKASDGQPIMTTDFERGVMTILDNAEA